MAGNFGRAQLLVQERIRDGKSVINPLTLHPVPSHLPSGEEQDSVPEVYRQPKVECRLGG